MPTRYAEDRDGYRVPEPRTSGRGYDPMYGDSPSGQFAGPLSRDPYGNDSAEVPVESVSRSRRAEAIDRGTLQRPTSGAPTAPEPVPATTPLSAPPMSGPPMSGPPMSGPPQAASHLGGPPLALPTVPPPAQAGHGGYAGPPPGAEGTSAFAAPTALTAAVPPPSADQGGAVYRSKRPGLAVVLVVLTAVFELPVLRLFLTAATAQRIEAGGTLAGIFMIVGLPMFAMGLYGLVGGAAGSLPGARAWLRTPLAYLPVALLLFIAAGLSA
ncbi:hypothetical protein ACFFX1_41335 [Dactylosporangium sucinum]|uniref:hypothetical protein n=1 Tax=Dactylosporangium sucinum TaxID=1424081 RepID=UPI00167EF42B|nr:hypothetical protein [Dactylosporangium sucinum]